jgi:hypothetical protein
MNNEQTLSATNIVALFQTNKADRKAFAQQVIAAVVEGHISPIQVQLQLKAMEDIVKQINANNEYKEVLINEVAKKQKFDNAEISVIEAGVKYDYTNCNDDLYNLLVEQLDAAQDNLRERETFLKSLPSEGMDIITQWGEARRIYPPIKTSSTTTKVLWK